MTGIDHFMWAAGDLDVACAEFEQLTGVRPAYGGKHPGFGTQNALASLGDACYVELLAPDPAQHVNEPLVEEIRGLASGTIFAFHVKREDLESLASIYEAAGISCRGPFQLERQLPDGGQLRWRLLIPGPSPFGRAAPIFIDWMGAPHPAKSSPSGCILSEFEVGCPSPDQLQALYDDLGVSVPVRQATRAQARAVLATARGEIILSGSL